MANVIVSRTKCRNGLQGERSIAGLWRITECQNMFIVECVGGRKEGLTGWERKKEREGVIGSNVPWLDCLASRRDEG